MTEKTDQSMFASEFAHQVDRDRVLAEIEQAAKERDGEPLIVLGHEIDKADARQVYGALCWIENQLLSLIKRD
jgi:hypothetical protein